MSTIAIREEDHTYIYNSTETGLIVLPSVTTIIKDVGIGQDFSMVKGEMDWYGDRGQKIHKACHLDDINDLDDESVHEDIMGYLEGYRKFKKVFNYKPYFSEQVVSDVIMGYAGTLDNAGNYVVQKRGRMMIGDVKSGTPHESHGVQLAAYRMAFKNQIQGLHSLYDLIGIYVKSDGTFKIEDYTKEARAYERIFKAALCIYNTKRRFNG